MQLPDDEVIYLRSRALGRQRTSELTTRKAGVSPRGSPPPPPPPRSPSCRESVKVLFLTQRILRWASSPTQGRGGPALLTQPMADRAAPQSRAHRLVAAWPGPGRGPPSLQLTWAAAITCTAEKVGTQTSSKGKKSPERCLWFPSILSRNSY